MTIKAVRPELARAKEIAREIRAVVQHGVTVRAVMATPPGSTVQFARVIVRGSSTYVVEVSMDPGNQGPYRYELRCGHAHWPTSPEGVIDHFWLFV